MSSKTPILAAARLQITIGMMLLALAMGVVVGLDLLARNKAIAAWFDRKDMESSRQTRALHYHLNYAHTQEELWLFDLSKMDFSKGGVYFLGPSAVELCTRLWELPPNLQTLIHNFGVSTANTEGDLALLRFLIEKKGLLAAGGEKTLVVLDATYINVWYPADALPDSFTNAMQIHGLYFCDPQRGIQEVPVNPVAKFIDFEESREAGFMIAIRDVLSHQVSRWRHHGVEPLRPFTPDIYANSRKRNMGPDWKSEIKDSIAVFRQVIDYLQSLHVSIRVVIMPYGQWEKNLPYEDEYTRETLALCAEKHVPVSDWSDLLTDDEFADSTHANSYGVDKIQPLFLDMALTFLRSTHALPDTASTTEPSKK
jgi:hypothetical protein